MRRDETRRLSNSWVNWNDSCVWNTETELCCSQCDCICIYARMLLPSAVTRRRVSIQVQTAVKWTCWALGLGWWYCSQRQAAQSGNGRQRVELFFLTIQSTSLALFHFFPPNWELGEDDFTAQDGRFPRSHIDFSCFLFGFDTKTRNVFTIPGRIEEDEFQSSWLFIDQRHWPL
jgi:hypothetical protein